MPGVPGLYLPEQVEAWKKVVDAVHAKGGYIYAQLWHSGRASVPLLTGMPCVSSSATPLEEEFCFHAGVKYEEYPPREMTAEDIKRTIAQYSQCAKSAIEAGFDGIELHGGNGYREYSVARS